ncbi:MAG: DUF2628 domain-containing protein [Eubacterium sp.]|nr:DUF2628 domain-containing protein [Eubacterium sp.]
MIFHNDEKCPVCDKLFNESDDIVICPHCATPHHRECYNQLGHCANKEKHKDGFDYRAEQKESSAQHTDDGFANEQPQKNSSTKTVCRSCGAEIDKSAPFCNHCGERQLNPVYEKFSPVFNQEFSDNAGKYADSDTSIDGVSAEDVAITVKTNTSRFLPKFVKNKKISWNWAGFIFGPYYLFFRKMYKEGIVALAAGLIANLFVSGFYLEKSTAVMNFILSHAKTPEEILALTSNPPEELLKLTEAVMPMYLILGAVTIVIGIVVAMFADSFYRSKVLKVIKKVDENLNDGSSIIVQDNMFAPQADLNQEDMRKLYLSKLGGTSIFSPIAAYCVLEIIMSIISKI